MSNTETKEALVGLLAITELLASEFKDGVQVADFADIALKIQGNEELKKKLMEAYNGIDKVPSEVKELSVAEAIDLVAFAIPQLMNLIGAIKK
jgi:hypothetical protein